MNEEEVYKKVQEALGKGKVSKALDLLLELTDEKDQLLREDALLLKSKFEYNRNQYEVKGILTEQAFNIQYSKTILGVQDILERLAKGTNRPLESEIASSSSRSKIYQRSFLAILVVALLAIGAFWYFSLLAENKNPVGDTQVEEIANHIDQDNNPGKKKEEQANPSVQEESKERAKKQSKKQVENPNVPEPNTSDQATPPPVKKIEKMAEPPPAKTFAVNIMRNSDMSDAKIFVDGQAATILNSTPIVITIQVAQKQTNHVFELKKDEKVCQKELLIRSDGQKVIFGACN